MRVSVEPAHKSTLRKSPKTFYSSKWVLRFVSFRVTSAQRNNFRFVCLYISYTYIIAIIYIKWLFWRSVEASFVSKVHFTIFEYGGLLWALLSTHRLHDGFRSPRSFFLMETLIEIRVLIVVGSIEAASMNQRVCMGHYQQLIITICIHWLERKGLCCRVKE